MDNPFGVDVNDYGEVPGSQFLLDMAQAAGWTPEKLLEQLLLWAGGVRDQRIDPLTFEAYGGDNPSGVIF